MHFFWGLGWAAATCSASLEKNPRALPTLSRLLMIFDRPTSSLLSRLVGRSSSSEEA